MNYKDGHACLNRLAEHLSNFWFGNYVSIKWWDELWLETALADYIKYRAVDQVYPAWNIVKKIYNKFSI